MQTNKNTIIMAVAALIILIAIATGFIFVNNNKSQQESLNTTPVNTTPTTGASSGSKYKNGTYTAEGSYQTHANTEKIGVTVTLDNDVITDVEVNQEAVLPMSKLMQSDFAANYKPMVVGKNIDEVNLGKVSGSSLTPNGFNSAIQQIKSQAKS